MDGLGQHYPYCPLFPKCGYSDTRMTRENIRGDFGPMMRKGWIVQTPQGLKDIGPKMDINWYKNGKTLNDVK